jgi:hypothetical protein
MSNSGSSNVQEVHLLFGGNPEDYAEWIEDPVEEFPEEALVEAVPVFGPPQQPFAPHHAAILAGWADLANPEPAVEEQDEEEEMEEVLIQVIPPPAPEPEWDNRTWGRTRTPVYPAGTMIYARVPPKIRCSFKALTAPFYLGPIYIYGRVGQQYRVDVPDGFRFIWGNLVPMDWCQKEKPMDGRRIVTPHEGVDFTDMDTYTEIPIEILEIAARNQWEQNGMYCRVKWRCYGVEEETWEKEWQMRDHYPQLFA